MPPPACLPSNKSSQVSNLCLVLGHKAFTRSSFSLPEPQGHRGVGDACPFWIPEAPSNIPTQPQNYLPPPPPPPGTPATLCASILMLNFQPRVNYYFHVMTAVYDDKWRRLENSAQIPKAFAWFQLQLNLVIREMDVRDKWV